MTKTLQPIGNSLGLIIDKPILSILGITASTPLEISLTKDGKGLLIRPIGEDEAGRPQGPRACRGDTNNQDSP